jgi:hypothetical protein
MPERPNPTSSEMRRIKKSREEYDASLYAKKYQYLEMGRGSNRTREIQAQYPVYEDGKQVNVILSPQQRYEYDIENLKKEKPRREFIIKPNPDRPAEDIGVMFFADKVLVKDGYYQEEKILDNPSIMELWMDSTMRRITDPKFGWKEKNPDAYKQASELEAALKEMIKKLKK